MNFSGVPAGSEFSDDFATGLDSAWVHAPAAVGGLLSAPWSWDSGGFFENDGTNAVSSAFPRTNPDGDFWWVYARPGAVTGDDVLTAHLRIVRHDTDTQLDAEFLKLDIDTDEISVWRNGTGGELASAAITTANDTPYLIHAHVSGANVIIRRGQLGQPLETVLVVDDAPIQATDRFILSTTSACIVDDVNIGNFSIEYAYDALGRRIEKRAGGDATRYVYDGSRVAEEWSVPDGGSPSLEASYVYGLYIDEVLTMRRGGDDFYYHGDDMHNVVKLTDEDGEVVEAYDYADYGQPEFYDEDGALLEVTASAFGNPYLFSGREWDEELGYYYFRNRYMDPGLGRFVSRDPLGLWGDPLYLGNGYAYVGNRPWTGLDPFGLYGANAWHNAYLAERMQHGGETLVDLSSPRFRGTLRVIVGSIGAGVTLATLTGEGLVEGASLGAATPVALPAAALTSAGLVHSLDNVFTGLHEVRDNQAYDLQTTRAIAALTNPEFARNAEIAFDLVGGGKGLWHLASWARAMAKNADDLAAAGAKCPRVTDQPLVTGWRVPTAASDKIPANWGLGSPPRKGIGMRWTDPMNRGNGVRIDKVNPARSLTPNPVCIEKYVDSSLFIFYNMGGGPYEHAPFYRVYPSPRVSSPALVAGMASRGPSCALYFRCAGRF